MRPLQVRQGAVAGFAMSLILSPIVAGQSADPPTFLTILSVTLTVTVLGTAGAVAINRWSRPPDAG
jgi:predicted PurR-regulated permease PerM